MGFITHDTSHIVVLRGFAWVLNSRVVESRDLARILVSEGETSWVIKSSVVENSWIRVDVARIPEQISYY